MVKVRERRGSFIRREEREISSSNEIRRSDNSSSTAKERGKLTYIINFVAARDSSLNRLRSSIRSGERREERGRERRERGEERGERERERERES